MVKKANTGAGSGIIVATTLLITLSVVVAVFDAKNALPAFRDGVQDVISNPIKSAASWPHKGAQHISAFFSERQALHNENIELKRQIAWLKANLSNQTALEAEYRRLKQLLDSTATRTQPVMIAEVLDSQIDAHKHEIEINKGSISGTFQGQIAIDENGVVGQITDINGNTATISLVTDERQRIPVFIERNRLRMIARGSGNLDELEMDFVSKNADVRVGDIIVTSGLGKRFPRGYALGTVTDVISHPSEEFLTVTARPLAALDKILEILLIQPIESGDEQSDNTQSSVYHDKD